MSDAIPVPMEDRVKARLLQVATSCLEHARTVRFGTGAAAYSTTDGDLTLNVTVQVTSTVTKSEKSG
jgi:hypothetical protein